MRPVFFRRDIKTRHEVYVFIICVILSLLLWLLIKASAESEASVSFPVEFVNIPENKILVDAPVKVVTLGFEEKAASLFFFKYFRSHEPISISVAELPLRETDGKYKGKLFTNNIVDFLNKHREIPYTILTVSPDTITILFEDKRTSVVPVKADFQLDFKRQFDLYDTIRIIPDSISLSGPASMIENISKLDIGTYRFSDLEESKEILVDTEPFRGNDLIECTPEEVKIIIPVAEYTEATAIVPVTVSTRSNYSIKTFPSKVSIRYLVALKDYQEMRPEMFEATVTADSISLAEKQKLRVKLTKQPSNARVLIVDPDQVEFIILK